MMNHVTLHRYTPPQRHDEVGLTKTIHVKMYWYIACPENQWCLHTSQMSPLFFALLPTLKSVPHRLRKQISGVCARAVRLPTGLVGPDPPLQSADTIAQSPLKGLGRQLVSNRLGQNGPSYTNDSVPTVESASGTIRVPSPLLSLLWWLLSALSSPPATHTPSLHRCPVIN